MLIVLSIVMMTLDHNQQTIRPLRTTLNWIITPFQYMVSWPIDAAHWAQQTWVNHHQLSRTNKQLREQLLQLQGQLQRQLSLEQENTTLRALLNSASYVHGDVLAAQLLAVNTAPFVNEIIINKGSQAHVALGQPVIDASGIMGQVIEVNQFTSRVLLIDDTRSAIPVQVQRNGIRAIADGRGTANQLTLLHIPETADIKVGDLLVTSGLGQRFPIGYPVATVTEVIHSHGETFATIIAKPRAQLNRSRYVLLVWPNSSLAYTLRN